jgi:hypothetical protein
VRRSLPLAALLALAGCGGDADEAPEPATTNLPGEAGAELPPPPDPPGPGQTARLDSRECSEVVQLYLEALGGRDYALAARVWDDPVIDGARLEAVFGRYRELQLAWTEPVVEGAAGSLYCTVSGTLTDAQDPAKPPVDGTLLLRRANDVPGATPGQLRWTLRASTFVERLERSGGGEP